MTAGILLAIVCGGLLGFAFTYFLLPTGNVVQTKSGVWRTSAYIFDDALTSAPVPDTSLNITTRGSTRLVIRFVTQYVHFLDMGHNGISRYQINLTLNGVTLCGGLIEYVTTSALIAWIEICSSFVLEFVTEPLSAGTYTVGVSWNSQYSVGSTNSLLEFCAAPLFNYSRSLIIQEILS